MSGGSYNYMYCRVSDEYIDRMFDSQLNSMMKDLVDVIVVKKDIAIQSENSKRNGSNKLRLMCRNKLNQSLKEQRMNY